MIVRIEDTLVQTELDGEITNSPKSKQFSKKIQTVGSGTPLVVDCWVDNVDTFLANMGNPTVISIREQ